LALTASCQLHGQVCKSPSVELLNDWFVCRVREHFVTTWHQHASVLVAEHVFGARELGVISMAHAAWGLACMDAAVCLFPAPRLGVSHACSSSMEHVLIPVCMLVHRQEGRHMWASEDPLPMRCDGHLGTLNGTVWC